MALSVTNCAGAGVHANGDWQLSSNPRGKYFKFDISDWRNYFGSFTSGENLLLKQCRLGRTVYTGEIHVSSHASCEGYCGRRHPGALAFGGDWQRDDYIVKPEES
eukprot:scaffold135786_cov17-Cyclotella_meneghiniana.AAC.1